MKKIILSLSVLFLFPMFLSGQEISTKEAEIAAVKFYFERVNYREKIVLAEISPREIHPVEFEGFTVFYAVNINPAGFVLVSADKSIEPILAYSFETTYQPENQPPPFVMWVEQYEKQIAHALEHKTPPLPGVKEKWDELLALNPLYKLNKEKEKSVDPMLLSAWDQGQFYNQLCPPASGGPAGNCYTGCVATAMGQLCYYFRWPDSGVGSYSYQLPEFGTISANFEETDYAWNQMENTLNGPNLGVAELLFHLGVSVDMVYGPDGSGMYNHKAAYSLRTHFKYAPETEYLYRDSTNLDWDSTIIAHLDRGIPMYYAGWSVPNLYGHAFIVDGYQAEDFFHFNWGWGGSYDGYFYLDNLTPGGSNFNLAQELVINCAPDIVNYNYPEYCAASHILSSLNGTIDDGSGPQYDYLNNASCSWLISPQTSQDSVSYIALSFDKLQTQEDQDIITIYDGPNINDPVLGQFSGNQIPGTLNSSGNQVLVAFESNEAVAGQGWFLSYTSVQPVWCNGMQMFTEPTASLSDGSGSFYYRNGSACMWNIQPEGATEVTLYFTVFETEEIKDVVKIYDAGTSQLLETYSGYYEPGEMPEPVTSPSGKMLIAFSTNPTVNAAGWEAYYTINGVGIETLKPASGMLQIFPNPAKDKISIDFSESAERIDKISILSIDGKLMDEWKINEEIKNNYVIDMSNFNRGIYFLSILSNSTSIVHKIILK